MQTRTHHLRSRVANACDTCKLRKTKCNGGRPCAHCVRRGYPECLYTAPRRRPRPLDATPISPAAVSISSAPPSHLHHHSPALITTPTTTTRGHIGHIPSILTSATPTTTASHTHRPIANTSIPNSTTNPPESRAEEHDETEVPREARLLRDPHGKLIFVGDCAPLSFFQTVRRLVTTLVDPHAFAPEPSGYSILENVSTRPPSTSASYNTSSPPLVTVPIQAAVQTYLEVTAGLIDIFDDPQLSSRISAWATALPSRECSDGDNAAEALYYLVLAIGCHQQSPDEAHVMFEHARDLAFGSLSGNIIGTSSVQVFILLTIYILFACQINAAFLFFGIAARAAYSIGIHRAAVNARFGPAIHRQRDRLWKSLRVVDLVLSVSMGRPPATSDVDCSVVYREMQNDGSGEEVFDLLNASAQILIVTETIVVEVYSRRKVSPRLTEGISRDLRDWSGRWLKRLRDVVDGTREEGEREMEVVNGACQVLSSYYYAVILVSRPFLMVELHQRLSGEEGHSPFPATAASGKSKLADACIDAAMLMVEPVQALTERGLMTRRAPVIVSWLFASSLVLGVGLLGGFGRIIEKHCRASIAALEHFAEADAHAKQYSLIAKSLLATALDYLEKKEIRERQRRTESSSQLFGLVPQQLPPSREFYADDTVRVAAADLPGGSKGLEEEDKDGGEKMDHRDAGSRIASLDFEATFMGMMDSFPGTPEFSELMGMGGSLGGGDAEQGSLGALNLFPLLETDGHIDLANYF